MSAMAVNSKTIVKRITPELWDEHLWGKKAPPSVFLIKAHYRKLKIKEWNNERVFLLCRRLKITFRELCALVHIFSKRAARKCIEINRWPQSICLHFHQLESLYFKLYCGVEPVPTMPLYDIEEVQAKLINVLKRIQRKVELPDEIITEIRSIFTIANHLNHEH